MDESTCILGFTEWTPPVIQSSGRFVEEVFVDEILNTQIARRLRQTAPVKSGFEVVMLDGGE